MRDRFVRLALLVVIAGALPPSLGVAQDRDMLSRVFGQVPAIAQSEISDDIPAGSIEVTVVDEKDEPVEGAGIRLGIMKASNSRESVNGMTDADGKYTFEKMATGTAQSYRVNVPYEGARYSSTPFRLDHDKGQRVRIRRLDTTQDLSRILQILGRTIIEFKDNRLHVSREAQLANVSPSTFVFPDPGLKVQLPDGFTAFQAPKIMTDQRLAATDDGMEIRGSIPPGRVTLRWAYDIPYRGSTVEFEQPVPFRTMEYQVMSDFVDGMELQADGFAPQFVHDTGVRRFLVRRIARRPGDSPLESVKIGLVGLPSSGRLPLIATAIALLFVVLGFVWTLRPREELSPIAAIAETTDAIVSQVRALDEAHAKGDVGPKFYERERQRMIDDIALLLQRQRQR